MAKAALDVVVLMSNLRSDWRAMRIGPSFLKIGKAILYPVSELDAWDEKIGVTCRASKRLNEHIDEQA